MSGYAALEAFIAGVEQIRELNEKVAKAAVEPVAEVARASAAAGETPAGETWAPRKDGGKPLAGAAAAIKPSSKGTQIILQVGPPFVFHHWGAGGSSTTKKAQQERARHARAAAASGTKSKFHAPRRQILPVAGEPIPDAMKEAIVEAAKTVIGKAVP